MENIRRMIGFFLKKNFCDGWDNVLYLLVPNIIISLSSALAFFILSCLISLESSFALILTCAALIILLALVMVLAMAFSENAAEIANFSMPSIASYFRQIPKVFPDAFRYGALIGLLVVAGAIGIPVYNSMGGILGNALALLLLAFEIVFFLSLQWFVPLRALLHDNFSKCLKKCFIIFFDNTAFSIFMFFHNFILAALSFMIFTVLPGTCGIVLAQVNALRLRLYKYDWLDANPQFKSAKYRKNIPWDALLENDRTTLGPRPFKSFFMPYKQEQ